MGGIMTDQPKRTSEYGEPWDDRRIGLATWDIPDGESERYLNRAIVCVNALASIPDPAKFLGDVRETLKYVDSVLDGIFIQPMSMDDHNRGCALSKVRTL